MYRHAVLYTVFYSIVLGLGPVSPHLSTNSTAISSARGLLRRRGKGHHDHPHHTATRQHSVVHREVNRLSIINLVSLLSATRNAFEMLVSVSLGPVVNRRFALGYECLGWRLLRRQYCLFSCIVASNHVFSCPFP
jgi:hypothetical protein